MMRYALRRLLVAIPTFLIITLITFAVVHLAPGNPGVGGVQPGGGPTAEAQARIRAHFGLDDPPAQRYWRWVVNLARLDFGRSFHDGRPVRAKLLERLPATLGLAASGLLVALLVAIPAGALAAVRAGGWFDRLTAVLCFGLSAIPRYVMGMVLIVVVGVRLGWLPFMGAVAENHSALGLWGRVGDVVRHGALIGICFMYPLAAYLTRFVRENVAGVLGADYIRTARANGSGAWRVLWRHALPNALIPLLTAVGLLLPGILSGAVILEVMFSWPGMGGLMFDALQQRDYPVILGGSAVTAFAVLAGTLVIDLLYAAVDPRVRYA